MKCDELIAEKLSGESFGCEGGIYEVYDKSEVDAAIAELKAKLEDVQATAYAESVDAGMENCMLKRALWLARAERARDNSILLPSKFMRNVWDNVERKCRAKAEEYK